MVHKTLHIKQNIEQHETRAENRERTSVQHETRAENRERTSVFICRNISTASVCGFQ